MRIIERGSWLDEPHSQNIGGAPTPSLYGIKVGTDACVQTFYYDDRKRVTSSLY